MIRRKGERRILEKNFIAMEFPFFKLLLLTREREGVTYLPYNEVYNDIYINERKGIKSSFSWKNENG